MKLTGYRRSDGKVGIRNDILVMPSVTCANIVAENIARQIGAKCVTHQHGCAQLKKDMEFTKKTIMGFCLNPNVGGIIIVGLGCEGLTAQTLAAEIKEKTDRPVECLIIQDQGTDKTIELGVKIGEEMKKKIAREREEISLSDITLALECGGSDVTSGLAANPVGDGHSL